MSELKHFFYLEEGKIKKINVDQKTQQIISNLKKYENITFKWQTAKTTNSQYIVVDVWDKKLDELIETFKIRISDHQDVYAQSKFSINPYENNEKEFLSYLKKYGLKKISSRYEYQIIKNGKIIDFHDSISKIKKYLDDEKYQIRRISKNSNKISPPKVYNRTNKTWE